MRKIAANLIYPVSSPPIKNGYLVIDDYGKIVDLLTYNRSNKEIAGLEYYSGILIPGFVNAHCHLELSHLKGKIEQGKGLYKFIKSVKNLRHDPQANIENKLQLAFRYMWSRGINGLADVVNSPIGLDEKRESKILTHNFIELFNESLKTTDEIINHGVHTLDAYSHANLSASMVPHSIYGTNMELLTRLNDANNSHQTVSMHFFESKWEAQLDATSVFNYLDKLSSYNRILLVHNLNLNLKLFELIKQNTTLYEKLYWVLCPNSNRYIKSQLPPIRDFYEWGMRICLGTDSLASNQQLSVLDEMKTISSEFPELPFQALLKMATLNGACALGMESQLGSFEVGKTPGVLLLTDFDFRNEKQTQLTEVTRLV